MININEIFKRTTGAAKPELIFTARKGRRYLLIQNNSTANIFVSFTASTSNQTTLIIRPGGEYNPTNVPDNTIYVRGTGANQSFYAAEG